MSGSGKKVFTRIKEFIINHNILCIWGVLYIASVIAGLFYTPWQSDMVDGMILAGNTFTGISDINIAVIFFPGSYDLLSFFFGALIERGEMNILVAVLCLLVLSAERIIENVVSKKFSSEAKIVERIFISFFSTNVIFFVTACLFALITPLLESLPDMTNSFILKILAVVALVLFIPVILYIVLGMCSFTLCSWVSVVLYVNHIPGFLICIAVLIVAIILGFLSSKISDFIARVVWSILPFLRPLADLLK